MNRLTPYLFWTGAEKYFDAAKMVCNQPVSEHEKLTCSASFPAYFLVGRSIELSLKAFLLARGLRIDQLRGKKYGYGHDLSAFISESRLRKLGLEVRLSKKHITAIKILNIPYKNKLLEYSEVGTYKLPYYWILCEVASKLVVGLKEYCYRSTFKRDLPKALK